MTKPTRKRSTPQQIKRGLYFTWGVSLLMLVSTIAGIQTQRQAIKTVGKDATPSIVTAQRLKDAMAGMDAFAASEFLVPPQRNQETFLTPSKQDPNNRNIQTYSERYRSATERLVAAAENITYGKLERQPIQTMQWGLGEYIVRIQQARDAHARGDATATLAAYKSAAEIMDTILLPAADALSEANFTVLDDTYKDQKYNAARSLFFIVVVGIGLVGILVVLQVFLSQRTRRTFNPLLLAATAIALMFLNHTVGSLLSASQHLKSAKEDAFDSMHALRQARAIAYEANADGSRYLLDPKFAANHEQAFFDKINKIANPPMGQSLEDMIALVAQGAEVESFTGLLGDELNNATFDGEKEAVIENLSTLATYLQIDKQMRQLQQAGKRQDAIALNIGTQKNQSNWAFQQFKDANQKAYDVNSNAFESAIKQGFQDLEGFETKSTIVIGAIALLVLFGLLPRLKEYS
jgi:hypothetical protein